MTFKNYYKTLGLIPSASQDEIKKSFRDLSKKHHPDLNGGSKESEEKFKEILEAYEVLSDETNRYHYNIAYNNRNTASHTTSTQQRSQTYNTPRPSQPTPGSNNIKQQEQEKEDNLFRILRIIFLLGLTYLLRTCAK